MSVVSRVFASITRTNTDGKLSIRDLRQWYITFGRHALASGDLSATGSSDVMRASGPLSSSASVTGGDASAAAAAAPIVTMPVMRSLNVHLASTATKQLLQGGGRGRRGSKDASGKQRALYPWEQRAAAAASGSGNESPTAASASSGAGGRRPSSAAPSSSSTPQPPAPSFTSLPNGVLELQVRLSPEEYAAVTRLRRQLDAEARYRNRIAEGQARAAQKKGGVLGGNGAAPLFGDKSNGDNGGLDLSALRLSEPYSEPLSRDAATLLSRST